ncbi:tetratricopeptide repeat protein [Ramlibacter albus]|uniref:Tetratricopeptide repeat protein n=1 Tax=Ramlibacter albus TaxID=2079448 RepID=A0A923MBK1_9BURK|nr:tetratricopeptide repeat protein [Ramlibacter albus]MBC5766319.1 tetratricopeptide repeat protein [Ramlibacter albus]
MNLLEQGDALLMAGRFHEALNIFAQALRADTSSLAARYGLSRACAGAGDALTAIAWISDAQRIAPQDPEPLPMLADLLLGTKQYAQALPVYKRLYHDVGLRDRVTVLHYAFCLEQTGELEACVEKYREAIGLDPNFLEAHVDLAGVLWRLGDFDGSLTHAWKAVNADPDHPFAVRILGSALLNLNRVQEAEVQLRRALDLKPGFHLAELDLAFTLLQDGRLHEGWRYYAKRWKDVDRIQRPPFWQSELEWQGPTVQPPAGKRIAVYAEQGLGDVLQFARYIPMLQADGATVYGIVPAELVPLLESSIPGFICLAPGRDLQADYHAALLELPLHYGTNKIEQIPAEVPYLRAPQEKVAEWAEKLSPWSGKFKVGLAWCGYTNQMNNRNRAMYLSNLQGLLGMPGVQCFSLQKSDGGEYTDIDPGEERLVDLTADWRDFGDSAAMIQNLDLVITVDTSIAHLTGALGKPGWVMLAPNADWRWLMDREDSPWYPTLRLFRRGFTEPRATQAGRVVRALENLLQQS